MLSILCMQLTCQPLYILLLKNKNDENYLLDVISRTNNDEEKGETAEEKLLSELERYNYESTYDEDIKVNLNKYIRILEQLEGVIKSNYNIAIESDLTTENLKEFKEILAFSETTSTDDNVVQFVKEKVYTTPPKNITLKKFNKNNNKIISNTIALLDENKEKYILEKMSPKEAFIAILEDIFRKFDNPFILIETLLQEETAKKKNIPDRVFKSAKIVENQNMKYPETATIKFDESEKRLILGYHYNAESGMDALYRVITALGIDFDFDRISFDVKEFTIKKGKWKKNKINIKKY